MHDHITDEELVVIELEGVFLRVIIHMTKQDRLVRLLPGGAIVQTPDSLSNDPSAWELAAGPEPGMELRTAIQRVSERL